MRIRILFILLASLLLVGCTQTSSEDFIEVDEQEQTQQQDLPEEIQEEMSDIESPEPLEINNSELEEVDTDNLELFVEMTNFSFIPNEIPVVAGSTYSVTFLSIGGQHGVIIDQLGIEIEALQMRDFEVVDITIPEGSSGQEITFISSNPDNVERGMTGKFIVE